MTELRVNNFPEDIIAVMDGYSSATGKCRGEIVAEVMGEWAKQKKHEAILICRVTGCNPLIKENERNKA